MIVYKLTVIIWKKDSDYLQSCHKINLRKAIGRNSAKYNESPLNYLDKDVEIKKNTIITRSDFENIDIKIACISVRNENSNFTENRQVKCHKNNLKLIVFMTRLVNFSLCLAHNKEYQQQTLKKRD